MIVAGEHVARFVSDRLGFGLCPPYVTLGIERDGQIIAGAILNHFEGADIHITVAGHGWNRRFLCAIGEYVFDKLGCQRMTFITEQSSVVRLAERLGGKIEGMMRNHFGFGRNGTIIGVLAADYRYGKPTH
jgi:hypothetical protein